MEETSNGPVSGHGPGCQCPMCGGKYHWCGYGHHRFALLRWILGIIILAVVFCIGVKIGQFKAEYGNGYGGYGHGGGMRRMMPENMYYRTGGMMGGNAGMMEKAVPAPVPTAPAQ